MSTPKIHLDEDADAYAFLHALRHRGVDVTSSREQRLLGCIDVEQLRWATTQGRVVFTYNASDFCRLHAEFLQQGRKHSGIVIADQQVVSIGEQMRRLLRLCEARTAADMENNLEYLSNWA